MSGVSKGRSHGESQRTTPDGRRLAGSVEYSRWQAMKRRCDYESHPRWERYGGRGIKVCDRWLNGDGKVGGFECFLADMKRIPEPKDDYTIERKKVDVGYEPDNCHWATYEEQNRNTSQTKYITFNGKQMKFLDAFDKYAAKGLKRNTAIMRLWRGERPESALCRPPKKRT